MRFLMIVGVLLGFAGGAAAFSDSDRAAIESVIARQLNAFLANDGATAYSFAAPNITQRFPTPDIFMRMVEQGYQPVYRSRSHSFTKLEETSTGLVQTVDIVDAAGEFWTAVYTLQRQPDGSWKISGCYLQKKPGESV
jgi:hypothetical protein